MAAKKPSVFIFGYYGAGNIGDELILAGLLNLLPAGCRPLVCSRDPDSTRASHPVAAVKFSFFNWPCLMRAISKSRQVIIGGGDLFQEKTSRRSLRVVYYIYRMARFFNKPVFLLGISAEPAVSKFGRRSITEMVRGSCLVVTRGSATYNYFRAIAGGHRALLSGVDLALARPPAPDLPPEIFPRDFIGQKIIGVSVRDWFESNVSKNEKIINLAAALDNLISVARVKIVFLPFHFSRDRLIENKIISRMKNPDRVLAFDRPLSPNRLWAVVKGLDLVIGMRLHSLIMGTMLGKPVFSLSYSSKNSEYMKQIGRDKFEITPNQFNYQTLADFFIKNI